MGATRLIITVSLAVFCVDVDFFALNLAPPATARGLGVTTTDLQWAITVFQLASASRATRRPSASTGRGWPPSCSASAA